MILDFELGSDFRICFHILAIMNYFFKCTNFDAAWTVTVSGIGLMFIIVSYFKTACVAISMYNHAMDRYSILLL